MTYHKDVVQRLRIFLFLFAAALAVSTTAVSVRRIRRQPIPAKTLISTRAGDSSGRMLPAHKRTGSTIPRGRC